MYLVQLGRMGDLVNVLPLCRNFGWTLVTSGKYKKLLSGCSWLKAVYLDVSELDLLSAVKCLKGPRIITQLSSNTTLSPMHACKNWQREQWRLARCLHLWDKIDRRGLFDLRNKKREAELVERFGPNRLVLALDGVTSPLPSKGLLVDYYTEGRLLDEKLEFPFDLLGLLESSRYVITADSFVLHLMSQVATPYTALLAPGYLGSTPLGNCKLSVSYQEIPFYLANLVKEERPMMQVKQTSDITVVITNHQRPALLKQAVDSCITAGIANLVISSTGTTEAVREVHRYAKSRIPSTKIVARTDDDGCNMNWLRGVQAADTRRVHILHDDDMLLPAYKQVLAGKFDDADVIHFDGAKHGLEGVIPGNYTTRPDLQDGTYPLTYLLSFLLQPACYTLSPVAGIFPRDHAIKTLSECERNFDDGFYLRKTMMVGNDLLLWLRACQNLATLHYTHIPMISYGHWDGSCSFDDASFNRMKLLPVYKRAREYYLKSSPRILHVVQRYYITDYDARQRQLTSEQTWELAYRIGLVYPRHQWQWQRDSSSIGDKRQVPFLKDVLRGALDQVEGKDDYIVLTNDDTMLNQFFWFHILHALKTKYAVSSFRRNVTVARECNFTDYVADPAGLRHCGRDAFAFTQDWLKKWLPKLPDYVMTYCDWDSTLDMLMRISARNKPQPDEFIQEHPASNIPSRFVFHIDHEAFWSKAEHRKTLVGNQYCRKLTDAWFAKYLGWPMPKLGNDA